MNSSGCVTFATSAETEPTTLALALAQGLGTAELSAVVVFGDPDTLRRPGCAQTLQRQFGSVPVVGCTTAGELDSAGYRTGHVTAVGFPKGTFTIAAARIQGLGTATLPQVREALTSIEAQLAAAGRTLGPSCFAWLLADGLSMAEESLTYLLQGVLGGVPLFGGSAGDRLRFQRTDVVWNGELATNSAIVLVISTDRPFRLLRTQHFVPSDVKLVVTGARPAQRIVTEFNGLPAAEEYARCIGVPLAELAPSVFAQHPLMIRMGGSWYVRAILKVNDDGSLTNYCAIDEGLVLTVGRGIGLVEDLRAALVKARDELGSVQLVLGCDCILRRLESAHAGLDAAVQQTFAEFKVVGFSTYGEQIGGVHVNQTFTGVAIG